MSDSAYRKICKERCPEGCGRNLPLGEDDEGLFHRERKMEEATPCTAPTPEAYIEEQAAEIATLQKRVEELERIIRTTQEDGLRIYTATKEDNDLLSRQLAEEKARGVGLSSALDRLVGYVEKVNAYMPNALHKAKAQAMAECAFASEAYRAARNAAKEPA